MIFTAKRLRALCPQPANELLPRIALALEAYAPGFGVDTPLRRAHFLGQIAHESAGFTRMSENLNYSAARITEVWKHRPEIVARAHELEHRPEALGNAVYAGRLGNGDEASGDGFRYRARGPGGLTFRDNYRLAGVALGLEFIGNPNQVAEPEIGVRVALWFWQSQKRHDRTCNDFADLDDVEGVTRIINGGVNGLADRRRLTAEAKTIFTEQPKET